MPKYIARLVNVIRGEMELKRATKNNTKRMMKKSPESCVFINAKSKKSALETVFVIFRERQARANEVIKSSQIPTELSGFIELPVAIRDGMLNLTSRDGLIPVEQQGDFLRGGDIYG